MPQQRRFYIKETRSLEPPLRQKRGVVDLPATNRMRNDEVNIGVSGRIIYARLEGPVWLEKLRVKFDVALDIDRPRRRAELGNLREKVLLSRLRKIHARLRAQMRVEEVYVPLNNDALDRVPGELFSFPGHLLFVGGEVPKTNANQCQHNDENNNDLPG